MKTLNFKLISLWIFIALLTSCSDESINDQLIDDSAPEQIQSFDHRSCGHTQHMEKLLSDPIYKEKYDLRMAQHTDYVKNAIGTRAICSNPTVIPVAVHYQGANSSDINCLISLAQESVAVLNADFQGINSDITNWTGNAASSFPGVGYGEACLEFVLADTNHPSGYGLSNGDLAVTVNATSGDTDANWSGYLNIYVLDANGNLGYAPLGGSGNGDGVVIDRGAFGSGTNCGNIGSSAPFNLGRTLTHEVGHYLLLDHIWGGGCNQDDGVADTPNSASDYAGCPTVGVSSCGSADLHMNYMDYTNDACMYMFTAGQATVTENYVASSLGNITSNAASVISGSGGTTTTGGGNTGSGGSTSGTGGGTTASCEAPTNASALILSSTSVKVTWDAQPQAEKYQVRYRVAGTTAWTIKTAVVAEKTLAGLAPSTIYQYQLRTRCPGVWTSYTSSKIFTTAAAPGSGTSCDRPTSSETEVLTPKRNKVTWTAMPQAITYQIRYRIQGTATWTTRISSVANRTLNALQTGATYEYGIRTNCPSGWTAYTATNTFVQVVGSTTGGGTGGGTTTLNTVNFNLTLDDYGSETSWELEDANNMVISTGGTYSNGTSGLLVTEMFSLADGCYTIFVNDAYGDGICCTYGSGSFEITDINGVQAGFSNGQFGNYDFINFCVSNNIVTFQNQQKDEKELYLKPKALNPVSEF